MFLYRLYGQKKHISLILSQLSIFLKLFSSYFNNHFGTPTTPPPCILFPPTVTPTISLTFAFLGLLPLRSTFVNIVGIRTVSPTVYSSFFTLLNLLLSFSQKFWVNTKIIFRIFWNCRKRLWIFWIFQKNFLNFSQPTPYWLLHSIFFSSYFSM